MGTTTFSGPIKAGTIKDTTGTTLGTDVKNTGQVVMAQSAYIDITGASHLNQVIATIPAKSQITDVVLNVTEVNDDTTGDAEASNVGSTDIQVVADFTGTDGDGTTGNATVTVKYLQNAQIAIAGDVPA
jgi:hypothetical protein